MSLHDRSSHKGRINELTSGRISRTWKSDTPGAAIFLKMGQKAEGPLLQRPIMAHDSQPCVHWRLFGLLLDLCLSSLAGGRNRGVVTTPAIAAGSQGTRTVINEGWSFAVDSLSMILCF
jgi:hypothetical protein